MSTATDWFDTLGTGVAVVLFVPAVSILLTIVFFTSWILALTLLGNTVSFLFAIVLTVGPLLVSARNGTPGSWPTRLRMTVYLLAVAVVTLVAIVVTFSIVFLLATFAVGDAAAIVAFAVSLVMATGTVVGTTAAIQDAGTGTNWGLNLRMAVACLLLAVLLVCFAVGIWVTSWLTVAVVLVFTCVPFALPVDVGPSVATIVTAAILAVFVSRELDQIRTIERHAGAKPIAATEYPELHAVVTGSRHSSISRCRRSRSPTEPRRKLSSLAFIRHEPTSSSLRGRSRHSTVTNWRPSSPTSWPTLPTAMRS